jgi:hypothetical protein
VSIFVCPPRSDKLDDPLVNAARNVAPSLGIDVSKLSQGVSSYDPSKVVYQVDFSAEKRKRILGIEVRSIEETVRDTLADLNARGWIA